MREFLLSALRRKHGPDEKRTDRFLQNEVRILLHLASKSRNSPWEGWKLTGKVRHTVYNGHPTVRDHEPTK